MRTFAKIIGYGLVLLLIAAAIGFVYKFTNGFNEDFKTFYVEYGSRQILTTENKMMLNTGNTHRFNVKYTFDKEDAEPKEYKVKIVTNMTRDFDYTVDGERYLFSKLGNLTDVFDIKKSDTFFELYLPDGLTFSKVLMMAQAGKSISVPADVLTNNPYPFRLQISSYNEKVTYNIDFIFGVSSSTGNSSSTSSGQSSGDNTNTPSTPTTPTKTTYEISYFFDGPVSNLSGISLTADTEAKEGEIVTFKVNIGDSNFSVTSVSAKELMSSAIVAVKDNGNNSYSFTMPSAKVTVRIYVEYNNPQGKTMYTIGYDSLGWAGMSVVNFICPDKAAANEVVTFTAIIKPEYSGEYKISHIVVQLGSGEEYVDLEPTNGTYTFTMPDTATMEDEINEGYINLLFYIIPIDM